MAVVSNNSFKHCFQTSSFSRRPKSATKTNQQHHTEQQHTHRHHISGGGRYGSDLIVPYSRDQMPVSKQKVYEVSDKSC